MKKYGPKPADHPTIGIGCACCDDPFEAGDYTAIIPLGPGPDPEAQEAHRTGQPYAAIAVEVHWYCAGGTEDPPTPPDPEHAN
jgi:hypothetical protein